MLTSRHWVLFAAAIAGICCSGRAVLAEPAPDYAAILAAPDRSAGDRTIDKRREPLKLLTFIGPLPGMRVLDVGAGGGYSSELLARAVAPKGVVYAQNMEPMPPRVKASFEARMKTPAMNNAVALLRPFDDPAPPELSNLDLITFLFFYHDTTYMKVDRAKMNAGLFAALKPGGLLIIADHSAQTGQGAGVGKSLHRVEEATVRREVEAAGFRLVASGNFLRQPSDTRDYSSIRPKGPVDNFVLKFQKPR